MTEPKTIAMHCRDDEVRAMLSGHKTSIRLILRPQPDMIRYCEHCGLSDRVGCELPDCKFGHPEPLTNKALLWGVGDRLSVREAWQSVEEWTERRERMRDFREEGVHELPHDGIAYRATDYDPSGIPWRPSVQMPTWAVRIELEITAVRIELLQDITDEEAFLEGVAKTKYGCHSHRPGGSGCMTGRDGYRVFWENRHGPRSWNANPWVACIAFKMLKPEGDGRIHDLPEYLLGVSV